MLRRLLHAFSFFGRASRREYWLTMIPVNLVLGLAGRALIAAEDESLVERAAVIVLLVALELNIALGVRCLHDRGRSGWWLVLLYGVPFGGITLWREWALATFGSGVNTINNLLILACLAWGLIELGMMRRAPGQNRYGGAKTADQVAATFT